MSGCFRSGARESTSAESRRRFSVLCSHGWVVEYSHLVVCRLLTASAGLMVALSGGQFFMKSSRIVGIAALVLAFAGWGCGGSNETPTAATPTTFTQSTETYSGTIGPGEAKPFHFPVT